MRILILSASVGAGHVRAAEAVELALRRDVPQVSIANLDVLTLMPPPFRKVYRDGYFDLVARAPRILGWLYDATDKPFHHDRVQRQVERAGATKLLKKIREFNADVAICTHFLPTALLDRERRKGRSTARIITVPAILVSAGGFGAGNAGRMVEALIAAKIPAQIVAVCGKSAPLKTSLEKIVAKQKPESLPLVKVVGFTTEMDELMAAADLMIGKPGGLTTSESLIKGLGWVVVNPIPGQEEKNAIYLLEHGIGVWSDNLHTLAFKVGSLLAEPGRLESMRQNALRHARPDAGSLIARFASGQGA